MNGKAHQTPDQSLGTDRTKSVLSVDHLVKPGPGWTSRTAAPLWCCPNLGKALPGFKPRRASRVVQVGSVAWFLSCGPLKAKPSHPRWRLGNWGAVSPQPSLAGHPHRGLWAPGHPGAWLTVLAAGWIQAGAPGTRLGFGYQGPGCLTFTPTSDGFIQVLLSSLP